MAAFIRHHRVRFGETDYAGIMFYPRYIDAVNSTIEDWFDQVAGCRFETLLDDYKRGSPLVSLNTEFIKANRLGDDLVFSVEVEKIGDTSITFCVKSTCDAELRARSVLTHVCVERDISKSAPWPKPVRDKFLGGSS